MFLYFWIVTFQNVDISLEVRKNMKGDTLGGKSRVSNSSSPVLSFKAY